MFAWEPNILAIPLIYVTALCLGLSYIFWKERHRPIILWFFYISICIALWSIGEFGQQGSQSTTTRVFWTTFNLTVIPFIPPIFFVVISQYVGKRNWINKYTIAIFSITTITDIAAIWTNSQHHLFYRSITMDGYVRGPLFYVHIFYIYSVTLFLNLLFLQFMIKQRRFTLPNLLLQLGFITPLLLSILVTANIFPQPTLMEASIVEASLIDWTPLTFAISLAIIAWGLYLSGYLNVRYAAQQTVMKNMSDAMFILDNTGKLIQMNAQAKQLAKETIYPKLRLGYSAQALLNRPLPAHNQNNTLDAEIYEQEFVGPSKKRGLFEARLSPLITHSSQSVGYVVVLRDINSQKQILADMVMQTKMAQEATKNAREANAFKSRLIARISHEFRTPVSAVIGLTGMLDAGVGGEPSQRQSEINGRIINNAKRLSKLIDNLLDQSLLENEDMRLQEGICNPNKLLLGFIHEIAQEAKDKGLVFQHNVSAHSKQFVYCDPNRLKQAITHILDNAIKFTHEGQISVQISQKEALWCIDIKDSGVGIPKEAQENIFLPFRQADETISRPFTGTGLGLSIATQLIQLMRGSITLQSQIDQGSTFTICLPLADVDVPEL